MHLARISCTLFVSTCYVNGRGLSNRGGGPASNKAFFDNVIDRRIDSDFGFNSMELVEDR